MSEVVELSRHGDHVALLEFENPPTNALSFSLCDSLLAELERLDDDVSVRAVVLTSRGDNFSLGGDLRELQRTEAEARSEEFERFCRLADVLERLRPPTVAAISGWCAGGGFELILCCDVRMASDTAKFLCSGVNVGLISAARRLPGIVGLAQAKYVLYSGAPFDARAAEKAGLVSEVLARDDLLPMALRYAQRVASRAPLAVEGAKRVANEVAGVNSQDGRKVELEGLNQLIRSRDHRIAIEALLDKSTPTFTRS